MLLAIFFLLGSAFTLTAAGQLTGMCSMQSNGCSVPVPPVIAPLITGACDRQVQCYNCGSMYGITQRTCDEDFSDNLEEACDDVPDAVESMCSVVGAAHRQNTVYMPPGSNPPYCSQPWVMACLREVDD
ncbi:hypothetical protein BaRGS_00004123 [Batillaria attramentaria]|uniref:Uncharacterized protein n=1 Tax=Batillaria attramentaria TaxID=370345 RepID=A0ABD0LYZ8_9CAEN